MAKESELNDSANLPDCTAECRAGGYGATEADFKRGFQVVPQDKEPAFATDNDGMNNVTKDGELAALPGGFLGRPQGWAR